MKNYDRYRFFRALSAVQKFSRPSGEKEWLDLGCHNGSFARLLISFGYRVTGIDVWSPELKNDNSWQYYQCNLNEDSLPISFKEGSFDFVSGLEIIEHVIDTDNFLRQIYKVLKVNGLFILSTPNINMLKNRVRLPLGLYPFAIEHKNRDHHVRIYNVKTLLSHLEEHGFRILLVEGINLLPQRFIDNRVAKPFSELFAKKFPSLCANFFVLAQK